jgi:hypothetical protein
MLYKSQLNPTVELKVIHDSVKLDIRKFYIKIYF